MLNIVPSFLCSYFYFKKTWEFYFKMKIFQLLCQNIQLPANHIYQCRVFPSLFFLYTFLCERKSRLFLTSVINYQPPLKLETAGMFHSYLLYNPFKTIKMPSSKGCMYTFQTKMYFQSSLQVSPEFTELCTELLYYKKKPS